jgi:adenosylcobinamide-GDP ribazoletransferase
MVYAIVRFPYARPSGLGTLYKKYTGGRELLLATASTLIITGLVSGIAGLLLLPVIWAWVRFVGGKLTAELGGLTGDTYGATAELTELLVYLAVFPLYGYWPGLFYSPWF